MLREGIAMRKIVDTILPTTMVGSYPRPHWFNYQLDGRDVRVAFKNVGPRGGVRRRHPRRHPGSGDRPASTSSPTARCTSTTTSASIGSFCWYMYERIAGFDPAKEEHPSAVGAATMTKEIALLSDWGGVVNSGPIDSTAPIRLVDLYKIATPLRDQADQGLGGRRAGQSGLARLLSSTTRTRASCRTRWRRSSTRR